MPVAYSQMIAVLLVLAVLTCGLVAARLYLIGRWYRREVERIERMNARFEDMCIDSALDYMEQDHKEP
jgi:hypothetical protein